MTKQLDNIIFFIMLIVILLLGYFVINPPDKTKKIIYVKTIQKDTVFKTKIIRSKPIILHGEATIKYIRDTVIKTRPFVATLDTITRDTISMQYLFPDNKFKLNIRQRQDTVKTVYVTITRDVIPKKKWYDKTWFKAGTYAVAILGTAYLLRK